MCLFVRHHHVRLACIVTVGIWNPDIFDITSFYGKGVVKLSSEAEVRPTLPKIGVHLVFLSNENKAFLSLHLKSAIVKFLSYTCIFLK